MEATINNQSTQIQYVEATINNRSTHTQYLEATINQQSERPDPICGRLNLLIHLAPTSYVQADLGTDTQLPAMGLGMGDGQLLLCYKLKLTKNNHI